MPIRSPYEVALREQIHQLHPSLRRYFLTIPADSVGVGEGVFAEFGTTRRWLWPLLRPFQRRGVLFAGYARSVRFRVENRTVAPRTPGPHPDGWPGFAVASRELELPGGSWVMRDSVALAGDRVVDRLGDPWTVSAAFDVAVRDGALALTSRAVGLVVGRWKLRLPRWLAPVVRLSEQHDPVSGLQRIELTVDAPLIGRVYGYRGHFSYGIVKEQQHD